MERALAQQGFRTLNLGYDARRKPLDALAEEIRPAVATFAAGQPGPLHFVTHSMGGLLARMLLASWRPAHMGRVVMLGPPNNGSAVADLVRRTSAFRLVFGPAGQQLTTDYAATLRERCGPVDYELGVIAGTRSIYVVASLFVLREANDGRVTVRSTRLEGMADHVTLPTNHRFMVRNALAIASTISFLSHGHFEAD